MSRTPATREFSRMIVGWQVSPSLRTDLTLDALDMGLCARRRAGRDVAGLIHHSDRGVPSTGRSADPQAPSEVALHSNHTAVLAVRDSHSLVGRAFFGSSTHDVICDTCRSTRLLRRPGSAYPMSPRTGRS